MNAVALVAGMIVVGALIGTWRSRRGSPELPNPFRHTSKR
jgi:hypothetical protein